MSEDRPLVIVRDGALLDDVLRLAAAAACELDCVPDVTAASANWMRAPLVVLDEQALTSRELDRLPRRGGVLLVGSPRPESEAWQRAFTVGIERVVCLPAEESSLVASFADVAEGPGVGGGRVLGVIGGRGGAGASVFAASVAIEAARAGRAALLVDCDGIGGGIDLVLGAEHEAGLRWPDLTLNSGRVSMAALREALLGVHCGSGSLVVLSCGRCGAGPTPDGIAAVLDAGTRAGCTVVCDLPRDLNAAGWQVIDLADLVAVVVPAEVRASASAQRIVERLADRARELGVVVRGPAPDDLPADAVADAAGARVLTVMRAEPRLGKALDRGEFQPKPSGPLAAGAAEVLDALFAEQAKAVA